MWKSRTLVSLSVFVGGVCGLLLADAQPRRYASRTPESQGGSASILERDALSNDPVLACEVQASLKDAGEYWVAFPDPTSAAGSVLILQEIQYGDEQGPDGHYEPLLSAVHQDFQLCEDVTRIDDPRFTRIEALAAQLFAPHTGVVHILRPYPIEGRQVPLPQTDLLGPRLAYAWVRWIGHSLRSARGTSQDASGVHHFVLDSPDPWSRGLQSPIALSVCVDDRTGLPSRSSCHTPGSPFPLLRITVKWSTFDDGQAVPVFIRFDNLTSQNSGLTRVWFLDWRPQDHAAIEQCHTLRIDVPLVADARRNMQPDLYEVELVGGEGYLELSVHNPDSLLAMLRERFLARGSRPDKTESED